MSQQFTMSKQQSREKEHPDSASYREIVADVIGLEDQKKNWIITDVDSQNRIVLVHYRQDADMKLFGRIRGLAINIDERKIVAESFGYTPVATTTDLTVKNNGFSLTDDTGEKHRYELKDVVMKIGFEGVVIRVFKAKGKVYFSTHRRLNTEKSKWGSSDTFMSIYRRLGAPSAETLFPGEALDSRWCYIFLLVDPMLLIGSRQDVKSGYVVHLQTRAMWTGEDPAVELKSVSTFPVPTGVDELYRARPLYYSQALHHLHHGFYTPVALPDIETKLAGTAADERVGNGEFLIIHTRDANGQPQDMLKVCSTAYKWRMDIRNNMPSLRRCFYGLLNLARINASDREGVKEIQNVIPITAPATIAQLKEVTAGDTPDINLAIYTSASEILNLGLLAKRTNRFDAIWRAFFISVPQSRRVELYTIYQRYYTDLAALIDFLLQKYKTGFAKNVGTIPSAFDEPASVITVAEITADQRKVIKQAVSKAEKAHKEDPKVSFTIQLRSALETQLVKKLDQIKLFRLIRGMTNETRKEETATSGIFPSGLNQEVKTMIGEIDALDDEQSSRLRHRSDSHRTGGSSRPLVNRTPVKKSTHKGTSKGTHKSTTKKKGTHKGKEDTSRGGKSKSKSKRVTSRKSSFTNDVSNSEDEKPTTKSKSKRADSRASQADDASEDEKPVLRTKITKKSSTVESSDDE